MLEKAELGDFAGSADVEDSTPIESQAAKIKFVGSERPTVGVELELSIIDRSTRELCPRAPELIAELQDSIRIKPELFQSIAEINTDVCKTVREVRTDLESQINVLRGEADKRVLRIICTCTHPFSDWRSMLISEDARYQRLVDYMQWPARRLLICGVHVHVGVKSGEHAIAVMNSLTVFLPHLLALSASSPYWKGMDSGLASSRIKIFESLPIAGLSPYIKNWSQFAELMQTLMTTRAISSIREIWWDIRPHPSFGTVETRICDGINTLQEVCAVTALVQCLVAYLQERYEHGLPLPWLQRWTIKENKWRATRYGDDAVFIRNERGEVVQLREHIYEWLEILRPTAEALDCTAELASVRDILEKGASYKRQRGLYEAVGSFERVVDEMIREMQDDAPLTA